MLSAAIHVPRAFRKKEIKKARERRSESAVSGFHQQPHRRWISLGILGSFLGFLLQPQVSSLYHVHAGGDHEHVHASLLLSPVPSRHSHHHHTHHHLQHNEGVFPAHQAPSHPATAHKTPAIRHVHTHDNGHWHTSVALHLASIPATGPSLTGLPTFPLQQERSAAAQVSPALRPRSRAPPTLFSVLHFCN